jgi:transcriptional regulator with XRE-family HTH domain
MDSTIYIRTKELCDERGMSITRLEGELGLGQYAIGRLKSSSNPTVETAMKIAGYFGVSVDYLIGASDIRTKADDLVHDNDFVSLQRARERMTDVDRDRMMAMLQIAFNKAFGDETASVEQYILNVEREEKKE